MEKIDQEIEFLRNTNRELCNTISVIEDRIALLKRRKAKEKK